jgi:DNA-binding Lrp family transcriptional regulator
MNIAVTTCKSISFLQLGERKSYISLASYTIYSIITNPSLLTSEKLYYFLSDLYSHLNEKIYGLRETEKSGQEWANLLGCSEEWVFQMQKKLESSGFFKIIREKDEDNQNEKNIIIPTLPNDVFAELCQEPNRIGKEYLVFIENNHEGCKRGYLDDSKMFIKFNLQMIKLLLADPAITALQKIIWIYFFCRSHIAYTDSYGEGTRNFITTYQEIANLFSCQESTVSIAVNKLEELGYISKKQFRIKKESAAGRRKKKSCWEISALFPQDKMDILLQQPDRQNLPPLTADDVRFYGLDQPTNSQQTNVSKQLNSYARSGDPHETSESYNKDNIININKNIDQTSNQLTNNDSLQSNVSSVFLTEELLASPAEIELGLKVADKFDEKAFALEKHMPWEKAIKQADGSLTNVEHWLVTKAAFTLQQQYSVSISNTEVNTDQQFSDPELRLIELWNCFTGKPEDEANEFLLRKSWVLKLLEANVATTPQSVTTRTIELPEVLEPKSLPGDKQDKAIKFAYALRERGMAQGYAAEIGIEELAQEFIYHAATWVPEKLNCKTREEQIDAALSFAWRSAAAGTWRCPYGWLNAQIQKRELEAALWKKL